MSDIIRTSIEEEKELWRHQQKQATKILYALLAKGSISMDTDKELYLAYSDMTTREMLQEMADDFRVIIENYKGMIYLMPEEENDVVGMKMDQLRRIAYSQGTNVVAYLSMYMVTVILQLFFNGVGERLRTRDYIGVKDLVEMVDDRLVRAASKALVAEEEEEASYNIQAIHDHWIAMKLDNENRTSKASRYGYARSVVNFLRDQGLLIVYDFENIRPTTKLIDLMGHHFLDQSRREKIERLFSEKSVLVED